MEKINYRGYDIEISEDNDAEDPRSWGGSSFTMICAHRRYNLGDVQAKGEEEILEHISGKSFDDRPNWMDYDRAEEQMNNYIDRNFLTLPLYLYEHSGITMSTGRFSCPWDSGMVGCIYISLADARKHYGVKKITAKLKEEIYKHMRGEVETYDDFLTGNVWGYNVEATGDSCWGFFGDYNAPGGLLEQAKDGIDWHITKERKKHWQQVKTWIRAKVPFMYRTELSI
jgi:hypothetical protein